MHSLDPAFLVPPSAENGMGVWGLRPQRVQGRALALLPYSSVNFATLAAAISQTAPLTSPGRPATVLTRA